MKIAGISIYLIALFGLTTTDAQEQKSTELLKVMDLWGKVQGGTLKYKTHEEVGEHIVDQDGTTTVEIDSVYKGITSMTTTVGKDTTILKDSMIEEDGEESFKTKIAIKKDSFLNPFKIESRFRRIEFNYSQGDGPAVASRGKSRREIAIPQNILTESVLYRILPLLNRAKGTTYSVEAFTPTPAIEPMVRPCTITSAGMDKIQLGAKEIECTKFEYRGYRTIDAWVAGSKVVMIRHQGIKMELIEDE